MAPHTSPAALPRLWLAAAALALLLGCAGAPADAAEQVYIWRDASGLLRFDAVQTAAAPRPPAAQATAPRPDDGEPARLVLIDAPQPAR